MPDGIKTGIRPGSTWYVSSDIGSRELRNAILSADPSARVTVSQPSTTNGGQLTCRRLAEESVAAAAAADVVVCFTLSMSSASLARSTLELRAGRCTVLIDPDGASANDVQLAFTDHVFHSTDLFSAWLSAAMITPSPESVVSDTLDDNQIKLGWLRLRDMLVFTCLVATLVLVVFGARATIRFTVEQKLETEFRPVNNGR